LTSLGAKVLYFFDSRANKSRIIDLLLNNIDSVEKYSLKDGVAVLEWLDEFIHDSKSIESFTAAAKKRHPLALAFGAEPAIPAEDNPNNTEPQQA
jgi:hypothetical protein